MKKEMNDYPLVLTAKEVAEILKVSKPVAYTIMSQEGFPLLDLNNRCKRTVRDEFCKWLLKCGFKMNQI